MSYRALGENVYQFGPAAGSSPGIQFEMIVTVSGLSGLRNAYRSVLSAVGSCEISGASRWLEAAAVDGPEPRTATAIPTAAASAAAMKARAIPLMFVSLRSSGTALVRRRLAFGSRLHQNRPRCE